MRNRTYKQIESSRNTRLWITDVILPVTTIVVTVGTAMYNNNLNFRYNVNTFVNDPKAWFKNKLNKKK